MDPETQRNLIIIAVGLFMVTAFWAGWNMSETRERHAATYWRTQYHEIQRQKREMTSWVRQNWPSEYYAYRHGHKDGYQQGVIDSPKLDAIEEYGRS